MAQDEELAQRGESAPVREPVPVGELAQVRASPLAEELAQVQEPVPARESEAVEPVTGRGAAQAYSPAAQS